MKTKTTSSKKVKLAKVNGSSRRTIAIKPSAKISRFLVTGAVRGASLDNSFFDNLEAYAKHTKAQILIAPLPSAISRTLEDLPARVETHRIVEELRLTSNLMVQVFKITPQQIDPSTGLDRFVQADSSVLVASPKQRMRCVASSNVNLPKIFQGTGVCTNAEYRDNRQGHIAENDHVIGAIYVETNGETFNFRQITAGHDGTFIDLGVKVSNGKISTTRAEALVLGDLHCGYICDKVRAATKRLIREVNPRHLILHDIFDGKSVNHHEEKKILTRAMSYERTDLNAELKLCVSELNGLIRECGSDASIVIVKSNHDEFLSRKLDTADFSNDIRNLPTLVKLAGVQLSGKDALKYAMEEINGGAFKNVVWLKRDQDYKVRGWQLGSHGDLGSNGAKGSIKTTQRVTGRSITGHTHTPEILNETISVGTSTVLKMDYNRGPSAWMNTHALLYPNNRAQLINIIDGSYKL